MTQFNTRNLYLHWKSAMFYMLHMILYVCVCAHGPTRQPAYSPIINNPCNLTHFEKSDKRSFVCTSESKLIHIYVHTNTLKYISILSIGTHGGMRSPVLSLLCRLPNTPWQRPSTRAVRNSKYSFVLEEAPLRQVPHWRCCLDSFLVYLLLPPVVVECCCDHNMLRA